LKEHAAPILKLQTDEEVETLYEEWAQSLETKPYPSLQAISNVFQLALRRNPEIGSYNPLSLWDTHFVRELDDSGYIDRFVPIKTCTNKKGGALKAPPFLRC